MADYLFCTWCERIILTPTKQQRDSYRRTGRVYCSKSCGSAYKSLVSSETMANTNHKYASARMKANNPMSKPASRAKMKSSLSGRVPSVRRGNGCGPTQPEQILANALGWETNVIVSTGERELGGYPSHYKLDVANQDKKVCIEIDGRSHRALSRQQQDEKKSIYLQNHGWMVLRFSNQEILENLDHCLVEILAKMSGWLPC